MNKFIVVTSINHPTKALKEFSKYKDWQLVVVGDEKTPSDWKLDGAIYLGLKEQARFYKKLSSSLPLNHYARKNLGYLYCIHNGADVIADLDDDNYPYSYWEEQITMRAPELKIIDEPKIVNIYKYFTNAHIWPRGYPLELVNTSKILHYAPQSKKTIGVWQYLADIDPDVDAIYRLTNKKEVKFDVKPPVSLAKGVFCPFNSQNTIWLRSNFVLMFLPAFVTFRFTDILRSYIAQRCLWKFDLYLAFGPATVCQERNPHNYLADFQSEIPMYLNARFIIELLDNLELPDSMNESLLFSYKELERSGIVVKDEVKLCEAWISEFDRLR